MDARVRSWTWDLTLLAMPLIGLSSLLGIQALQIWERPPLRFVFIAILVLIVLYLISEKRPEISPKRYKIGLGLSIVATVFAVYSAAIFSPAVAHVSIVVYFTAWMTLRLGEYSFSRVLGWAFFAALTIPLPRNLDIRMESDVGHVAAWSASGLLDVFQVYHLHYPPFFLIDKSQLNYVEFLNDGLSVKAFAAFGLMIALIRHRSAIPALLGMGVGVSVCLIMKTVHLCIAIMLLENVELKLYDGIAWTLTTLGIAILSIVFIAILEALTGMLTAPIATNSEIAINRENRTSRIFNKVFYWPGTVARDIRALERSDAQQVYRTNQMPIALWGLGFLTLVAGIPLAIVVFKHKLLDFTAVSTQLKQPLGADAYGPDFFQGLRLDNYQSNASTSGNRNAVIHEWRFSSIDSNASLTVIYPFDGVFSGLRNRSNWEDVADLVKDDTNGWPWSETTASSKTSGGSQSIYQFSSQLHFDGTPLSLGDREKMINSIEPMTNRWTDFRLLMLLKTQPIKRESTVAIELHFERENNLDPNLQTMLLDRFRTARDILRGHLLRSFQQQASDTSVQTR